MLCFFANSIKAEMSVMSTFSSPLSVAVPPLPGATYTFWTFGVWASFEASACSRPPEPTTRSFISMPEVANTGKYHGDAPLVCCSDHFRVAHASAGLDDRRRSGLDDRIDAVAERE